jgi:hypothetical protein
MFTGQGRVIAGERLGMFTGQGRVIAGEAGLGRVRISSYLSLVVLHISSVFFSCLMRGAGSHSRAYSCDPVNVHSSIHPADACICACA